MQAEGDYKHLHHRGRYRVVREFSDFDDVVHSVGEEWTYDHYTYYFYEGGHTFHVERPDGSAFVWRLAYGVNQEVLDNLEEYIREL